MDEDIGLPPEQLIHGSCRELWGAKAGETEEMGILLGVYDRLACGNGGLADGPADKWKKGQSKKVLGRGSCFCWRDAGTAKAAKQRVQAAKETRDQGVGARLWLMRQASEWKSRQCERYRYQYLGGGPVGLLQRERGRTQPLQLDDRMMGMGMKERGAQDER